MRAIVAAGMVALAGAIEISAVVAQERAGPAGYLAEGAFDVRQVLPPRARAGRSAGRVPLAAQAGQHAALGDGDD